MKYYLSRRATVPRWSDDHGGHMSHLDYGYELDFNAAVAELANRIELEAAWLHAEYIELGGGWRPLRRDRLGKAAMAVLSFTDGKYREVTVDGIRFGIMRDDA